MSLNLLRRYVNAYKAFHAVNNAREPPMNVVAPMNRYYSLHNAVRRLPQPFSKSTTQSLKLARRRMLTAMAAHENRSRNAKAHYMRVRNELAAALGRRPNRVIHPEAAQKILNMTENSAAKTIARAVNRSALVNRAAHKRRARNMIAAELGFYANNSPIRPSKIARSARRN